MYIRWLADNSIREPKISLASTETLGRVRIADAGFEAPDGSPITLNKDYFGNVHDVRTCSGAFEFRENGEQELLVWKK